MAEVPGLVDIGLVFGKFYPLTKGHQFLIETARARCRRLYVAISGRPAETISQSLRAGWIRRLYPDVTVVEQPQDLPYYPEECGSVEEFYALWTRALREVCEGRSPDAIFTSEEYGETIARYLNCAHVLVDLDRTIVPISGTAVRARPFDAWAFLDPVVRAFFVKAVCVVGPESTGKSTLCAQLARHYDTVWQPEWARNYLGDRHCEYKDMEVIATEHVAAHAGYRELANKVLFVDTDIITTAIYSDRYFQQCPPLAARLADEFSRRVDLYLLMDIDVPWVPDTSRDLGAPHDRADMFRRFSAELESRGLCYVTISGRWDQRLPAATQAVDRIIFGRVEAV